MSNLTLFAVGLVVAIPTGIVVIGLVFASGADEREVKKLRMQGEAGMTRPGRGATRVTPEPR